jgi:hypothetical protein
MLSANIYQKPSVRGPVFENELPLFAAAISNKQPKGGISVWFPSLVITRKTWRLAQVMKST